MLVSSSARFGRVCDIIANLIVSWSRVNSDRKSSKLNSFSIVSSMLFFLVCFFVGLIEVRILVIN